MKRGPEVAFFGSSLVSEYWNGAATYHRGIFRALAEHTCAHRAAQVDAPWREVGP